MLFRLVVKKNGKRIRVVEVGTPITRVGRAHGNEIRIPSAQVSRKHCQLRMQDGLVMVEDLESVNGTFLNDTLLTGAAVVRPGDHLCVGPVTFVVEYELTPKALKRLDDMEFEIVEEIVEDEDVLDVVEAEDEVTQEQPKAKPSRRPAKVEEVLAVEEAVEEEYDVEEAVEGKDFPRAGLEELTWTPPKDGDLRDMLSQLDEGQESLKPKKRAGPRKPSDKNGKRRPQPEE
jgi:pSer/pThr/pTyr-binding forkhead associated (FHA) protein